MIKKYSFILFIISILVLASNAHAETLDLGGATFELPDGYVVQEKNILEDGSVQAHFYVNYLTGELLYIIQERKTSSSVDDMLPTGVFQIANRDNNAKFHNMAAVTYDINDIDTSVYGRGIIWADYFNYYSVAYMATEAMPSDAEWTRIQGYITIKGETAVEKATTEPTAKVTETPTVEPELTPVPAKKIAKGDNGNDVKKLQKRLIKLGYLDRTNIDGKFGDQEESAIKLFQSTSDIEVTGIADEATLEALYDKSAAKAPAYKPIKKGDKGDEVKKLQQQLINLGWLKGTADGDFGGKTEEALKKFQEATGLQKTGIADAATQKYLFSNEAPSLSNDGIVISAIDYSRRVEAVGVGSETKKISYEIVDKGLDYWKDSIGSNNVFAFIAIKNTDTKYIYLDSCNFDYEDSNGHLLDTASMVSSCPDVIGPGETGYFYVSSVNGGYLDDNINTSNGIKLKAQFSLEPAINVVYPYEVTDDSLGFEDTFGTASPVIKGRIRNNTNEDESLLYVNCVLKDNSGKVIWIDGTNVMNIYAGSTVGFSLSMTFISPRITKDSISSYEIIAVPYYYQW